MFARRQRLERLRRLVRGDEERVLAGRYRRARVVVEAPADEHARGGVRVPFVRLRVVDRAPLVVEAAGNGADDVVDDGAQPLRRLADGVPLSGVLELMPQFGRDERAPLLACRGVADDDDAVLVDIRRLVQLGSDVGAEQLVGDKQAAGRVVRGRRPVGGGRQAKPAVGGVELGVVECRRPLLRDRVPVYERH